jgi:hypothetical protein
MYFLLEDKSIAVLYATLVWLQSDLKYKKIPIFMNPEKEKSVITFKGKMIIK